MNILCFAGSIWYDGKMSRILQRVVIVGIACCLSGCADSGPTSDGLVLADANGVSRLVVSLTETGDPRIVLNGPEGDTRILFQVVEDDSTVSLRGAGGAQITLRVTQDDEVVSVQIEHPVYGYLHLGYHYPGVAPTLILNDGNENLYVSTPSPQWSAPEGSPVRSIR